MTDQPDLIERLKEVAADDGAHIKTLLFEAAIEIFGADDIPGNFLRPLAYWHFNEAAPMLKPEGWRLKTSEMADGEEAELWNVRADFPTVVRQTAKTPATALAAACVAADRAMKGGA